MNIIFIITINLICGICLGLYFQNIALYFLIIYLIIIIFKFFKEKIFVIGFLICLVFYFYSYKTSKISFENEKNFNGLVKVVSSKEETQNRNKYIVKFEKYKFLVYTPKSEEFGYGDILKIKGVFTDGNSSKNFNQFSYLRYLKQNKIYGIINVEEAKKIKKEKDIFYYFENLKLKLKNNLFETFDDEKAGFLAGVLLGDKKDVLDEIKDNFKFSSLSHILAISGLHVVYVSFGIRFLLDFFIQKRRIKDILIILFLVFFSVFTGGSPSCVRACIMSIMVILSRITL